MERDLKETVENAFCCYGMRRIIIALITMISIHGSVHAQEFDCRPLTCTMKNAGDYNVELAGCRNTLDIYLYDKDLMPVRGKSLSGYVEFFYSSDRASFNITEPMR